MLRDKEYMGIQAVSSTFKLTWKEFSASFFAVDRTRLWMKFIVKKNIIREFT